MIFNMTSGRMKTPVLNPSYPANATVFIGTSATFKAEISEDGMPAAYTYQWYVNGSAVSGATTPSYTRSCPAIGTFTVYCEVTNKAGTVVSRVATLTVKSYLPQFTYTGSYKLADDSNGAATDATVNWKIRFLTSGTLKFTDLGSAANGIGVFLVGGGGGGGASNGIDNSSSYDGYDMCYGGGGGGGGYTATHDAVAAKINTEYPIVVGAGGTSGSAGGTTSALGYSVSGGAGGGNAASGTPAPGGAGGNAGGAGGQAAASAGVNGGSGAVETLEFGESGSTPYAGGGGGGGGNNNYASAGSAAGSGGTGGGGSGGPGRTGGTATAGTVNTGGGGGGGGGIKASKTVSGATGGSGIVIIRNKR